MANSSNLLQITTKPAKIDVRTTRASLEAPGGRRMPKQNVQVQRGGVRMDSRPSKLNVDTYAARSSMGYGNYNPVDFMREEAQRGWDIARAGVERIVSDGNSFARGSSPAEVAVSNGRANFNIETFVDFIPKVGPEFSVDEGYLHVDIGANDVNINWEYLDAERQIFNPGSIEIEVLQYAEVIIEFVGRPLYFPPSADPNYVPTMDIAV
ncbi:MAG: DUF6470 family protein [Oscillospiraceae bacterium]|nr:DUF6470 family protein [Oscillospiraceae bacterium]